MATGLTAVNVRLELDLNLSFETVNLYVYAHSLDDATPGENADH